MVFSSVFFLFLFFPFVLTAYFVWPNLRFRNGWLLLASIIFYAWGEFDYVLLMLGSAFVNFGLGRWIEAKADPCSRKGVLALGVTLNLAVLVFFKYSGFILQNLNWVLAGFHFGALPLIAPRLPLGISFFTFHALSYLIDIYRGKTPAARKVSDAALYIFLFPQLIAGPILRWGAMAGQIAQRNVTLDGFAEGVRRFIGGLAKKVLIANTLAVPANQAFALLPEALTFSSAWIGVMTYALQIYFDFSGYSDMAIGMGKMFGFEFVENFDHPYIAQSLRDFWHRWHISLSTWFRDYLYFPLGGSHMGAARTHFNLLLVFFLCGLWHGANWTFVIWGLFHGAFLGLERTWFGRLIAWLPRPFRHAYALLVVLVGWAIFRADNWGHAWTVLRAMLGFASTTMAIQISELASALQIVLGSREDSPAAYAHVIGILLTRQVMWAGFVGLIASGPVFPWWRREMRRIVPERWMIPCRTMFALAEPPVWALLFVVTSAWLANSTYNPFLYFRF